MLVGIEGQVLHCIEAVAGGGFFEVLLTEGFAVGLKLAEGGEIFLHVAGGALHVEAEELELMRI